ncbi:unnamed protein product [Fraxinus pennsylvanica]|uniref:Uncharacterized protein n=1 Tax=Fraxinus pennsylvanica TaxID=56036 RepID=A0AAD2DTC6_9LAMI|nr:unnamed protein product [Fraxinus pennsylvanica]
MVYIEERLGNKSDRCAESVVNSSTIATIVTSLSGSPATVGIVRLSCPSAVSIIGRVFRSASKEKRRDDRRPTSHVVEYVEEQRPPSGHTITPAVAIRAPPKPSAASPLLVRHQYGITSLLLLLWAICVV